MDEISYMQLENLHDSDVKPRVSLQLEKYS